MYGMHGFGIFGQMVYPVIRCMCRSLHPSTHLVLLRPKQPVKDQATPTKTFHPAILGCAPFMLFFCSVCVPTVQKKSATPTRNWKCHEAGVESLICGPPLSRQAQRCCWRLLLSRESATGRPAVCHKALTKIRAASLQSHAVKGRQPFHCIVPQTVTPDAEAETEQSVSHNKWSEAFLSPANIWPRNAQSAVLSTEHLSLETFRFSNLILREIAFVVDFKLGVLLMHSKRHLCPPYSSNRSQYDCFFFLSDNVSVSEHTAKGISWETLYAWWWPLIFCDSFIKLTVSRVEN